MVGDSAHRWGCVVYTRPVHLGVSVSVLATADLFIKPERADEFLELLKGALPDTRAYEGCETIDTFVSQDEPGHIILVEKWAERANHESYLTWRTEQGLFEAIADFMSAPPRFSYFDPRTDV